MAINAIATTLRNTIVDAVATAIDAGSGAGTIVIYTAGEAATLATLTFSDPSYGSAAAGTAQENTITSDSSSDTTGTAAVFSILDSDANVVLKGTVGTSGEDINFNSVAFVAGDTVSITDLPITMPAS